MTTKQLIEQIKALIRIQSTADNPQALREAVDFVAKIIAKVPDATIETFEQNNKPSFLAYRGSVRPEKFDILLNAHVDVVPGTPESFEPVEKNGRLYGRGALDMKGTALALTDAFCELVSEVPYALGLQIVSDEEIGGYDGVCVQLQEGVRAEFVIMGEYANHANTIYNAARGLCWAEIAFKGKTAHGGHLWNGSNAVVKAGDFAGAVLRRYPTPDKETWTTTASIANLSTPNDVYNKVPDSAVLKIDFRFTQEDPVFHNKDSFRAFVAGIDPEAEVINLATFEPAVHVEELNPYVQGLSAALKHVTKKQPSFLGRPGGSDGRHFALVNNDIVEFGLYGQGSHSETECMELNSLDDYRATIREFLRKPLPLHPRKATEKTASTSPLDITLLSDLVAMPTVTGDFAGNNKALGYIDTFLAIRGMHVTRKTYDGYGVLVATTRKTKQPTAMLVAHLDVVPASDDRFKLQRRDGKLYGRGTWDMKNAIASYMALVDELQDSLSDYDFGIMLFTDDEGQDLGIEHLLNEGYGCKVALLPDGSDNWQIESGSKGAWYARLSASGTAVHGSRPWTGESASLKLLHTLHELSEHFTEQAPTSDTLNIGKINSGKVWNQVPDSAEATVDIRNITTEGQKRAQKLLQDICDKHDVTLETVLSAEPVIHDLQNPYMKQFAKSVELITGVKNVGMLSHGGCDAIRFMRRNMPCVVFRPTGNGLHGEDEWIDEQGFLQMRPVIKDFLDNVARQTTNAHRQKEIARLAKQLNSTNKPAYVWYATYASGLAKDYFMWQINGGGPMEGSIRTFEGCTDKTPPLRDTFMSLPYALYFSGKCETWEGGGHANVSNVPSASAHTIARAYLITVEQFEEIAAQQNHRAEATPLPLKDAMLHGHTTIKEETGHYNELVFCGVKDDAPIFTLTASHIALPHLPPSNVYTRLVLKGLSENASMDQKAAVEYIMTTPGFAGNYKREDIKKLYNEATER